MSNFERRKKYLQYPFLLCIRHDYWPIFFIRLHYYVMFVLWFFVGHRGFINGRVKGNWRLSLKYLLVFLYFFLVEISLVRSAETVTCCELAVHAAVQEIFNKTERLPDEIIPESWESAGSRNMLPARQRISDAGHPLQVGSRNTSVWEPGNSPRVAGQNFWCSRSK